MLSTFDGKIAWDACVLRMNPTNENVFGPEYEIVFPVHGCLLFCFCHCSMLSI